METIREVIETRRVRNSICAETSASRIKRLFPYGHESYEVENHIGAAEALAKELGWKGEWATGESRCGYSHVCVIARRAGGSQPMEGFLV